VELTSRLFLGLLLLLTLGAAAAVVVLWGRLAAPRVGPVLGRVASLVVVNLLVLLTVGAMANDTFGFFADWTDLAGAFQSAPHASTSSRGGEAGAAAAAQVNGDRLPPPPAAVPALPPGAPGQRQFTYTVKGRISGLTGRVIVGLPASYRAPSARNQRYPVIETFHGYPGTPVQWLDSMALDDVLDSESAARHVAPALVVAPQIEIPPGRDTECVDGGPGLPAVDTWLTQDVPDWVVRTFRVRTDRASWAVAGLSAGGWCAAMASLLYPGRYGAALVFGGYFGVKFGKAYQPWPPNSPLRRRYDLVSRVAAAPPPVAMWVETSHSDRTSFASTQKFLRVVRPPLAVHLVEFAHAGHSVLLWSGLVPEAVRWLGSEVPGFRPTPALG
jgi:enterochelin esterase-like enzyme